MKAKKCLLHHDCSLPCSVERGVLEHLREEPIPYHAMISSHEIKKRIGRSFGVSPMKYVGAKPRPKPKRITLKAVRKSQ